ncbi:O-6-methylguanine DNA methyltransferase [Amaricoccus macauensis]|uniref:methylated-DNA--[protein]-cysteine S-methyltransferase n=1 Tax=Amaricoccus macauensis TaxID=57001 RepID=A0A840SJM4_9RHOB|nr:methylated-DNA--[protein]-cysteine S-methyltransferase [Amaricoccus macauensis]MBB5222117.1 O-6-methylguanine DNA methyltransferase [Amaricoccus macauensis]
MIITQPHPGTPTRSGVSGASATEEIRFALGQSCLGAILVASSTRGVVAILLGDDPHDLARDLQDRFPRARLIGMGHEMRGEMAREIGREARALIARVCDFIESPRTRLDLPLDVRGTAFQRRVWQSVQEIPVGERVSYSELARRIGSPRATRAVAGACAANPVALAIPCHRVVRNDGDLAGYRWGVGRKRELLRREARA